MTIKFKLHFTFTIVLFVTTINGFAQHYGLTAKWQETTFMTYEKIPRDAYWYNGEE